MAVWVEAKYHFFSLNFEVTGPEYGKKHSSFHKLNIELDWNEGPKMDVSAISRAPLHISNCSVRFSNNATHFSGRYSSLGSCMVPHRTCPFKIFIIFLFSRLCFFLFFFFNSFGSRVRAFRFGAEVPAKTKTETIDAGAVARGANGLR